MRIGMISTEHSAGGAGRAMQRSVSALRALGHEVVLIYFTGEGQTKAKTVRVTDATPAGKSAPLGALHRFFNGWYVDRNRSERSNTLFWVPSVGYDLSGLASELGLDVVNVHWTSYFLSLRSLEGLFADKRAPVVFTLHDMAHFTGGCHYSAGCSRFEVDCRPCPQLRYDWLSVPYRVRERRADLYLRTRPHAIAPSRWMAEQATASGMFTPDRVHQVANALDASSFAPRDRAMARARFGLPDHARILLFGAFDGRERRKGFTHALEATAHLAARPELQDGRPMILLGVGADMPTAPFHGASLVCTGRLETDEDLCLAYSASDVLIMSSLEDNQPNILTEAMACGVPAAAFAVGGVPEYVREGETGALAQAGDAEGLAAAIIRVLRDHEKRDCMGASARSRAMELADPLRHAMECVDVFEAAQAEQGQARRSRRSDSPRIPTVVARPQLGETLGEPAAALAVQAVEWRGRLRG